MFAKKRIMLALPCMLLSAPHRLTAAAPPESVPGSLGEWLALYPLGVASGLGAIIVLLLGCLSAMAFFWYRARAQRESARAAERHLEDLLGRYNLLYDNMPILCTTKAIADDLRFTGCSSFFAGFAGVPREQIIGKTDFDIFADRKVADRVRELDEDAIRRIREQGSFSTTDSFFAPDGTRHQGIFFRKIIHDENGGELLFSMVSDVSELELAKRRTEEYAERLRLTLNSIGDGVIATDADGAVMLMNPVAERMTGYSAEAAIGKPHEQIFHIVSAIDENPVPSPITRVLRTGNTVELANHTDLVASHGKRYHIADSAAPIRNKQNEITGAILVFRDVTEEYLQRARLNAALAGLEYAAGLSHAAYFQMDFNQNTVLACSREFPALWPVREGKAVPAAEYMNAGDFSANRKVLDALHAGERHEAVIDFHAVKDGVTRFYQIRLVRDESFPKRLVFSGVIQDVTELTQKERQLADALNLWNRVLDTIPVMIFAEEPDNDYRFAISNRAFEEFMKLTHDAVIGHNDYELLPDQGMADYFRQGDEKIVRDNLPTEYEESVHDADGKRHHLKSIKIPMKTADGKRLLLGVAVDITESSELARNQKALNDCFSCMLNDAAPDAAPEVIKHICRRMEATRCHLVRFDLDAELFVPVSEYLGDSQESKPVPPQRFSANNALYRVLTRDGIAIAPDATDPGVIEQLGLWKEENERTGVKSIYCVLVRVSGKPWGYLGLIYENSPRRISATEQDFLFAGAHLTGLMLERQFADENRIRTIQELRQHRSLVEYGAALTRSGVFQSKSADLILWGTRDLSALCPIRDNRVLPPEDWVVPEDLPDVRQRLDLLLAGKCEEESFNFRSDYFGERRYYRVLFSRDRSEDEPIFFGAIQDVSEITCAAVQFRDTQEMWEQVINSIPMPFFAKAADDDLRYVLCNQAFADFVGKERGEIIGHTDHALFPTPEEAESYRKKDWDVLAGVDTDAVGYEETSTDGNGGIHRLRSIKKVFHTHNGKRLLLGVSNDISQLDRMIKNQKVINECLGNLIREGDMHHAIEMSLESICRRLNAAHCYIFQFDPERRTVSCFEEYSASGEKVILARYRDYPYAAKPNWDELFLTQSMLRYPHLLRTYRADGLAGWSGFIESLHAESLYAQRIMLHGKVWGYIGVLFDEAPVNLPSEDLGFIAAASHGVELMLIRLEYQKQIFDALEQARAGERAKSMFLASMSHEIRTPLNAIIGFSELLRNKAVTHQEQDEYLAGIYASGNALLELINDVLDLSKLEAGQMVLSPEATRLPELVAEVGNIFRMKCVSDGIVLNTEVPDNLPTVWVDKLRLRQILFNLIGNAVKFTEQGGVTVKVAFAPESEEAGTLTIHVIDTGCGISEQDQAQLFQLFVQASASRSEKMSHGGTGLGLAICRRLAEQMDGSVQVKSKPDEGSDFTVILHNVRYSNTPVEMDEKVPPPRNVSGKALHGLVVDDVEMNLKVMAAMLKNLGISAVQADSGAKALEAMEHEAFDFVLTDMWMPEMNGAEFAAEIRRRGRFAGLPIFAVTADIEAQNNFPVESFDGVLLKPVTLDKIRKVVDQVQANEPES